MYQKEIVRKCILSVYFKEIYILASDFFRKNDEYVLCVRNFYTLNTYLLFLFETNQMIIFCASEILKTFVLNKFFGTQYPFVLVWADREY